MHRVDSVKNSMVVYIICPDSLSCDAAALHAKSIASKDNPEYRELVKQRSRIKRVVNKALAARHPICHVYYSKLCYSECRSY